MLPLAPLSVPLTVELAVARPLFCLKCQSSFTFVSVAFSFGLASDASVIVSLSLVSDYKT